MKNAMDTNTDVKILMKTYAILVVVVAFVATALALRDYIAGLFN